jgi:putative hydrolase of the HAD superfamily
MFDMGGVVAKHSDSWLEKQILEELGVEGYEHFFDLDDRLEALMLEHTKGKLGEKEVWETFSRYTNIPIPQQDGSLWGKYFHPDVDTAMLDLIGELKDKGLKVVCATNTEAAHYEYHKNHGDYAVFDAVYSSVDLGEAKPETAFFETILSLEGVHPDQVFFTDDCVANCESAQALGIHSFHFADVADLRWHLYDLELLL